MLQNGYNLTSTKFRQSITYYVTCAWSTATFCVNSSLYQASNFSYTAQCLSSTAAVACHAIALMIIMDDSHHCGHLVTTWSLLIWQQHLKSMLCMYKAGFAHHHHPHVCQWGSMPPVSVCKAFIIFGVVNASRWLIKWPGSPQHDLSNCTAKWGISTSGRLPICVNQLTNRSMTWRLIVLANTVWPC